MTKARIGLIGLLSTSVVAILAIATGTFAWFAEHTLNDPVDVNINGSASPYHYASGTGTSEDPYLIRDPIHLYNLAWLQYLGTYNKDENEDGAIDRQWYFKLSDDIPASGLDMSGYTLPPIGTEDYPFIGNFNGNNKKIVNLITSNNETDFGDRIPHNLEYTAPKIVGFFGVIGEIEGDPIATYDSDINEFKDTTLEGLTVKSNTANTLIGLAAGYVNLKEHVTGLSNIKIGDSSSKSSSISLDGCSPISNITPNLSDYSLVGYNTKTGSVSNYTKKVYENYHKEVSGGQEGGFGSYIDFKEFNRWLYDLHITKSYDKGPNNPDIGYEVIFSSTSTKRINVKTGDNYTLSFNTSSTYFGNPSVAFYLTYYTTSSGGVYRFYSFDFRNDNTGNYYEIDNTKTDGIWYNQDFTWSVSGSGSSKRYAITFNNSVATFSNYSSFDLKSTNTSETNFQPYNGNTRIVSLSFAYVAVEVKRFNDDNYTPILFNDDKTGVASNNTGYIIGKSLAGNLYGNCSPKISLYDKKTYLSNSINASGAIKQNGIKYYNQSTSTWDTIADTVEDGVITGSSPSFERYINPRNEMTTIVDNSDRIQGIHFDYQSGAGNLTTSSTKSATMYTIMNPTATTYKMPRGSIDFYLQKPGYITFFAGSYTETASVKINFFSLYKINRPVSNGVTDFSSISSIDEISKIYKTAVFDSKNPTYVYQYVGGSEPASHGELVYDLSCLWVEKDNSDHTLYYFEIPVGTGEFAMGAVNSAHSPASTTQGAYMMYLDLGANGQSVGDTLMDIHQVKTSQNSASYPQGVDFNITGISSTTGGDSLCLRIPNISSASTGTTTFAVASNITITDSITNSDATVVYKKSAAVLNNASTNVTDSSGSITGGYTYIRATITTPAGENWLIEYLENLDGSGGRYTTITQNGNNRTISDLPTIYTSNISEAKGRDDSFIAVSFDFTGSDFTITAADYSTASTIDLTIPTSELGSTTFSNVIFKTGYSTLKVNGSAYPS